MNINMLTGDCRHDRIPDRDWIVTLPEELDDAREMITQAFAVQFIIIPEHIVASISEVKNQATLKHPHRQSTFTFSMEQLENEVRNYITA